MMKIALVDDHKLFRSGMRALLGAFDDLEVIMEAGTVKSF